MMNRVASLRLGWKPGQDSSQRQRAGEQALGAKFDIRDFHEVVLANGALPLDVLGEQVQAYIAATKAKG